MSTSGKVFIKSTYPEQRLPSTLTTSGIRKTGTKLSIEATLASVRRGSRSVAIMVMLSVSDFRVSGDIFGILARFVTNRLLYSVPAILDMVSDTRRGYESMEIHLPQANQATKSAHKCLERVVVIIKRLRYAGDLPGLRKPV